MTLKPLDLGILEVELRDDAELNLHRKHFDATIRVVIGATQSFQLILRDGDDIEVDPVVTPFDGFDIQLLGSEEQWSKLLEPNPPAFYQDFYPAMVHHGFRIEGNMEMIYAFLPAVRRLGDLFRTVAAAEVAA